MSLLEHPHVIKNAIQEELSWSLFEVLRKEMPWEDGIKTRFGGFTRKAVTVGRDTEMFDYLMVFIGHLIENNGNLLGFYVNYYETGEMWTPNHKHKGTNQLVISLGNRRTLNICTRNCTGFNSKGNYKPCSNKCQTGYPLDSGDAILFGEQTHGVPKELDVGPRISIATFSIP